jgi:hypothetical protein
VVLAVLLCVAAAGPEPKTAPELIKAAEDACKQKQWDKAIEYATRARDTDAARVSLTLAARADYQRALAIRGKIAQAPPGTPELRKAMIDCYKNVIARGDPLDRQVAANNLGSLYLREKNTVDAVLIFRTVPSPIGRDAFLFCYNCGRALAADGQVAAASGQFLQSVRLQPAYRQAAEAYLRLPRQGAERLSANRQLLDYYRDNAQARRTFLLGPLTGRVLAEAQTAGEADALWPYLLRYYLQGDTARARASEGKDVILAELHKKDLLKAKSDDLDAVLRSKELGKGKAVLRYRAEVFTELPAWKDLLSKNQSAAKDFALVLKQVGDAFDRQARSGDEQAAIKTGQAIVRYSAAFALDPLNYDAARQLTAALSDNLDRNEQYRPLLDAYAEDLLSEKGRLYATVKTNDDLLRIYSLHVILAAVYEKEGKWGPGGDVRSAVYQWRGAVTIQERLQDRISPKGSYVASPEPLARLAEAYVRAGQTSEAPATYLRAAQAYLSVQAAAEAGKVLRRLEEHSRDGKVPLSAGDREQLARMKAIVANTADAAAQGSFADEDPVHFIAVSADGKQLAAAAGTRMRALGLPGGERLGELDLSDGWFEDPAGPLAFVEDGKALVCAERSAVVLWDAPQFKTATPVGTHKGLVAAVAAAPGGRRAASCDTTGQIKAWDLGARKELWAATTKGKLSDVVYAPDGKRLAVAGSGGVTLWDAETGKMERSLEGLRGQATALAISADGRALAVGCADGTIGLWEMESGKKVGQLTGHQGSVVSVAFTASGLLASAAQDRSVRLWDSRSGTELAHLAVSGLPSSVRASPDGQRVYAGIDLPRLTVEGPRRSGAIQVWDISKVTPGGR